MLLYRILAFVFLVPGFGTVFGAGEIVKKFELDKKEKCNFENEMTEEELAEYKFTRASVNLKMIGMLIAIPGLVFVLLGFK